MKLYPAVLTHGVNAKRMSETNVISCASLVLVLLWLFLTKSLYHVGSLTNSFLVYILFLTESFKYKYYCHILPKDVKKLEHRKLKTDDLLYRAIYAALYTGYFFFLGVVFGAPVFSYFEETITFALVMFILAIFPCLLYLGSDGPDWLIGSLVSQKADDFIKPFLTVAQLTCFGAWLGAVVIPLDWNRPYQVWPIPCIVGALLGNILGNFAMLVKYGLEQRSKRKLKNEC